MTIIVLTMTNIVLTMTRSVLEEFDLQVNFHIFTDNVVAPGTEKRTVRWCSGAVWWYGVYGTWYMATSSPPVRRREQYCTEKRTVRSSSDAVDSTEKQ